MVQLILRRKDGSETDLTPFVGDVQLHDSALSSLEPKDLHALGQLIATNRALYRAGLGPVLSERDISASKEAP